MFVTKMISALPKIGGILNKGVCQYVYQYGLTFASKAVTYPSGVPNNSQFLDNWHNKLDRLLLQVQLL